MVDSSARALRGSAPPEAGSSNDGGMHTACVHEAPGHQRNGQINGPSSKALVLQKAVESDQRDCDCKLTWIEILRIKEGKGFFMLELEVEKRRRNRLRVVFERKEVAVIARREGRKVSTTLS